MEFFHKPNFDFMSFRKIAITGSIAIICVGLISLFIKGGPAFNIDFLGGTELLVRFEKPTSSQEVRQGLATINLAEAEIKNIGKSTEYIIRFRSVQSEDVISPENLIPKLSKAFPKDMPEVLSVNSVGPKVGHELQASAVWAVLVSLGLLLIYISFRFEFVFAVGAVIALFHDVLITLGIFSIFNREISLVVIGAFLTLVGYSLNDTIVVFDRIREKLHAKHRKDVSITQIINFSINETLNRTTLTSLTTLIVVLVSLIFGGEILRDFFLCLAVGIFVGTYSSVFIAAPIIVQWHSSVRKPRIKSKPAISR